MVARYNGTTGAQQRPAGAANSSLKRRPIILEEGHSISPLKYIRSPFFPLGWILLQGSSPSRYINPNTLATQMSNTSDSMEGSTSSEVSFRDSHGLISDLPARSPGVYRADAIAQRVSHMRKHHEVNGEFKR